MQVAVHLSKDFTYNTLTYLTQKKCTKFYSILLSTTMFLEVIKLIMAQ